MTLCKVCGMNIIKKQNVMFCSVSCRLNLNNKRECYACGTKSSIVKSINDKRGWRNRWIHNGNGQCLCFKCYNIILRRGTDKCVLFGRNRTNLNDPKIGVCNNCRAVVGFDCRRTFMHREQYCVVDPSKYIMETCFNCHNRLNIEAQILLCDGVYLSAILPKTGHAPYIIYPYRFI